MAPVALLLLVLLGAALPDLMPHALGLSTWPPDMFALLAMYLASRARAYAAVGWGITLGVLKDCLSLDPLGTHAYVLGFVAWLLAEGSRSRGRLDGIAGLLIVFLGTCLAGWVHALRVLPYASVGPLGPAFGGAVMTALWTTVLAIPLAALLDRTHALEGLLGRRRALSA